MFELYHFERHLPFDISLDGYCFIGQNSLSKGALRSIFKRGVGVGIDRRRLQRAILTLLRAGDLGTSILRQLLFRQHLLDRYLGIGVLEGALEGYERPPAVAEGGDQILRQLELDLLVGRDVSVEVEHIENIMIES